jgi:peptide/nickel transport system permease protein
MRDDKIRYITRRVIWAVFIYLPLISLMIFYIGRFGPGDPALVRAGPKASEEAIERIRVEMGLDKPIIVQYADYMKDFMRGDLGESLVYPDKDVAELIFERVPISAPIGFSSVLIAIVVGTIVGLTASLKRGTWVDNFLIGDFLFFSSIHTLILIQFLILIFSLKLGWLPAKWSGGWEGIFTLQVIIPIFTLSLVSIAGIARLVRTTTLNVLDQPYVRMARAKGLPYRVVALKYILRNALLPLVTIVVGTFFGVMLAGSFFVEHLYGIPGIGQFAIRSIFQRDYNVIMGLMMMGAILFVVSNLVQDIVYGKIDPRVVVTRKK